MHLLLLTLAILVTLVILALLVNVVGANLIRQTAYYRAFPDGDFDAARRRNTGRKR